MVSVSALAPVGADAAGPARATLVRASPCVTVYSTRPVIAAGIAEMLEHDPWRARTTICGALEDLTAALRGGMHAVVIDGRSRGADVAAQAGEAFLATVIVLVDRPDAVVCAEAADAADAVLVRDEVDEALLSMALTAGLRGLQIRPRPMTSSAPVDVVPPLARRELQALKLLADGCRDAEIASVLAISESAARKIVQRVVQRLGARTRCEAVTAALRAGHIC